MKYKNTSKRSKLVKINRDIKKIPTLNQRNRDTLKAVQTAYYTR